MNNTNFRLVLQLDAETQTYAAIAHNLSVSDAVDQAQRLQVEQITAAIVVQDYAHRAQDAQKCRQCKRLASEFADRFNQATTGPQSSESEPRVAEPQPADEQ